MKTVDDAKVIMEKFMEKYWQPPYSDFITEIGCTDVASVKVMIGGLYHLLTPAIYGNKPSKSDHLDDVCIIVELNRQPTSEVNFPLEFEGLKVFYRKQLGK